MLTPQNYFESIRTNLEYFPRHALTESAKVIFSIYTRGILPDEFFSEDQIPYKKQGMILVECSKLEADSMFTLTVLFQNFEENVTLTSCDAFEKEAVSEVWDFAMVFMNMVKEKSHVHVLSVDSIPQVSEQYEKIFENWLHDCNRIDESS